jgi:hypothetical protein
MNRTRAPRNLLLSLSLAAALAAPAYAQINFNINVAPPAPQQELVPVIQPGQVWAPGYWGWTGERHVWVSGKPILQREGYRWAPDRWDQRERGFVRTAGHWERDRDFKPAKVKKEKKGKNKNKNRKHDD